jgi:actin-related protein 10
MLKTGSPEMTREEYDTLLGESIARGEAYRAEQAATEAEVAALTAIDLESLQPGEALYSGKRRRGWREGVRLGDWAKTVKAA